MSLKYILLTISVMFYTIPLYCQNKVYCVLDKTTNQTLPFATIKFIKTQTGLYSDAYGKFTIPVNIPKDDSISISYIGYKPEYYKIEKINDSIFLNQKVEELQEIKLTNKKLKKIVFGSSKNMNLSWHIDPNQELAILMKPSDECKNCYLNKIKIPISKKTIINDGIDFKMIKPDFNSVFKVNIYSVENEKPSYTSLLKNPIIINSNQNSPDIISIDISSEFVKFSNRGVFISIEMIGNIGDSQEKSLLPLFRFSRAKTAQTNSISFYRNVFDANSWIPISGINPLIIKKNYNLGIELIVDKYE